MFAFQLRNPIHNGHALLMQDTRRKLLERGESSNIFWILRLTRGGRDREVGRARGRGVGKREGKVRGKRKGGLSV